MLLSDFNYHLPQELIAQEQAVPRDSARLMLINRSTGEISHHHIYDLPALLRKALQAGLPPFHIVANNTKVFPARILGHKSTGGPARSAKGTSPQKLSLSDCWQAAVAGGKVEILLTQPLGQSRYKCIARPGLKVGDVILFPGDQAPERSVLKRNSRLQVEKGSSADERTDLNGTLIGTITSVHNIERTIKFNLEESTLRTTLSQIGSMPTPPYIKKLLGNSSDYQTIYAKYGFSAAAPTAGLHFTPSLLATIKQHHPWNELTLNVGLGTFLPVKEDKVEDHVMHAESYTISPSLAAKLQSYEPCKKLLAIGSSHKLNPLSAIW